MATVKPIHIKIGYLVKFKRDPNDYTIKSFNVASEMIWAQRTNSIKKVHRKIGEIEKIQRKPVG